MKNIKCEIAYVGTKYFGFQKTQMGPSIEAAIERELETILQHPIKLQVASRTDRGVHARGQVVNFFTRKEFSLGKLLHSLRSLLPKDIAPIKLEEVNMDFHPTLDAKRKLYIYDICNQPTQLPFHREFSWHVPPPLHIEAMEIGAKILCGKHDYSAFTSERYDNPFRTVIKINCKRLPQNRLQIEVLGEGFLYKMVRSFVGTLVYVGCGKIPLDHLEKILKGKKRSEAGVTAPAHGLTLQQVFY